MLSASFPTDKVTESDNWVQGKPSSRPLTESHLYITQSQPGLLASLKLLVYKWELCDSCHIAVGTIQWIKKEATSAWILAQDSPPQYPWHGMGAA